MKVTLASGSPQRKEILLKLGIDFDVVVPKVEELTGGDPELEVVENARLKAESVARESDPGGGPRTNTSPAGPPPRAW